MYFFAQSVPFVPMRTSTILYSGISEGSAKHYMGIFLASGVGTFLRMGLLLLFVKIGIAVLPWYDIVP